ncbi:thioredoxin domain-containing protein [Croceitalea sp. MTPC5]|uniref:thioredoxin domain-containing protein n=1 Tax=Croceitalea sp. MTPC5 TaxID=3056565 RepID=UPI002B3ECB2C|nr:thioredoxin domain-containing protein [Croceitalea sp. MTPC5]
MKNKVLVSKLVILFLAINFSCKQGDINETKFKYTNELINESSPYLLQHAHNPVNWKAWGLASLNQAKAEDKLVLLSIGYSSCHWCHVMEDETFENEEVAELMNKNFVSIKVDREERPDIDKIYQTASELVNGKGGWPLNAIILPDGKPIYINTYHTKDDWIEVLSKFNNFYKEERNKIIEYADKLSKGIQDTNDYFLTNRKDNPLDSVSLTSIDNWKKKWDLAWGGDQVPEKFMLPINLSFLLEYSYLQKDTSVKVHVKNTLDKIIMGGVHDHIGGGFYRYSTDSRWRIPHFEKMLYDNAQMLSLFSKAYRLFGDSRYKEAALNTIEFLELEMKNPKGGYYAAIDADTKGVEGDFYIWEEKELKTTLKEEYPLFSKYFNINEQSKWDNRGYVLFRIDTDSTFSEKYDVPLGVLKKKKEGWKSILQSQRRTRIRPNLDDKIITSWNAMLISAYVEAYKSFGNILHLNKALHLLNFIQKNSIGLNGNIAHTYKDGIKSTEGFLDDYAFMIKALLDLFEITMDEAHLIGAENLIKYANMNFQDKNTVMFKYRTDNKLISKIINTRDGPLPSANSVMAHNLFKLGHIKYDKSYLKKSKSMLNLMTKNIEENSEFYANWNLLLNKYHFPYYEVVIIGDNAYPLLKEMNMHYKPNTLIIGSSKQSEISLFRNRYDKTNTWIYVCQEGSCKLPVQTVQQAFEQIVID